MIIKKYGVDFHSEESSLTLNPSEVSEEIVNEGTHTRTHESGWTITGMVLEDYFSWVNEFTAHHPDHGFVAGDFEELVLASSERAFDHFYEHHTPEEWECGDI